MVGPKPSNRVKSNSKGMTKTIKRSFLELQQEDGIQEHWPLGADYLINQGRKLRIL